MEYKGTFKRCDGNQEEKFIPLFERMVWAGLSRRLGAVRGVSIEIKIKDSYNEFCLKFPKNKKDTIDKILTYLQDYKFYEINYDRIA